MLPRGTIFAMSILLGASCLVLAQVPDAGKLREVEQKIQMLAVRDDTVANDQRPEVWLRTRKATILPQLVAGLKDANPRVADGCVRILRELEPDPRVLEAVLSIAADKDSPIAAQAILALVPYASDGRAARLMAAAYRDEKRFPEAIDRARLAAGGGEKAQAVAILQAGIAGPEDYRQRQMVQELAKLGPEGLVALEKAKTSSNWDVAREVCLALEKLDANKYALTADQRQMLEGLGRSFKEMEESRRARQTKLAGLNRQQVRPLVMQALVSSDFQASQDALAVLTLWRDKEALPEIAGLIERNPHAMATEAMSSYLSIDGGADSDRMIIERLRGQSLSSAEYLLRAILRADIPVERKLHLLREGRNVIADSPYALPWAMGFYEGDLAPLLGPLMDEESDLRTLGAYAERAAQDKKKRFGGQIARSVRLLASAGKPTISDSAFDAAATCILDAAAEYDLKDMEKQIAELATSSRPAVRVAATTAAARLSGRIDENAKLLVGYLGDADPAIRKQASEGLRRLKPTDAQRRELEAALLMLIGQPGEAPAMQVLAKFGGEESAKAIVKLLDDQSLPRALLAPWTLAQIQNTNEQQAALRRLAIYGMFQHQGYQQGEGIDFSISEDVSFHQTLMRLNPARHDEPKQPVRLPEELCGIFPLRPEEQAFAIRAYRYAMHAGPRWPVAQGLAGIMYRNTADASHLSLLEVVASEDAELQPVYVKDQRVAHLPERQMAAKQIARITGKPASYLGLAGERLDSAQLPSQPYPDQVALIARFALDWVEKGMPEAAPVSDWQWRQIEWRRNYLHNLAEAEIFGFGGEVKTAMLGEIERRNLKARFEKLRLLDF